MLSFAREGTLNLRGEGERQRMVGVAGPGPFYAVWAASCWECKLAL